MSLNGAAMHVEPSVAGLVVETNQVSPSVQIARALSFENGFDASLFRDVLLEDVPASLRHLMLRAENELARYGDGTRFAVVFSSARGSTVVGWAVYMVQIDATEGRAQLDVIGFSPAGDRVYEAHERIP
jgi:hypothetical protein